MDDEKHLIFRIIKYGIRKEVFTLNDLKTDLKLDKQTFEYVFNHLFTVDEKSNPNHIISTITTQSILEHVENDDLVNENARLLPNAIFQYVDYLEIKAAREAAKESKKLAWIAIWISAGIGLLSLIVGFLQLWLQT